jgi:formylglycine-generating enzyme required for sulfatase activity
MNWHAGPTRWAVALLIALSAAARAADDVPAWVEPMKEVRSRFTGTPGTLALFGDSISVSLAFWAPLRGEPLEMPPAMAGAHRLVKSHQKPECWAEWRGPEHGNNGRMTIRWADENVPEWLQKLNPEVAIILFGTNDLAELGLQEFEQKTAAVVERCLANGTVVLLTTLPPRSGLLDKSRQFAEAVRRVAKEKRVPLIDYQAEILRLRPDDWDGTLPQFKDVPGNEYEAPTLISRDGVHPSNPQAHKDFSAESLKRNGFLLRNYLTLLAYSQVIERVLPKSSPAEPPGPPAFPFDRQAAARYQREYAERVGLPLEITAEPGLKLLLVPPGKFNLGSPADEPGRKDDEAACEVTLTRPFYLGQHEVTVAQFRKFALATRHVTDGEKNGGGHAHDDRAVWEHRAGTHWQKPGYAGEFKLQDTHPVVHVSHADATAFCRWLNQQPRAGEPKGSFALPTEAQWEWACRAGSATRFWWGADEDSTGRRLNVGDRSLQRAQPLWPRSIMAMDDGHAFPAPVGSYEPNAFGLCDMLGNVWEFCSTRSGLYPKEPAVDPGDLSAERGFAVRGGGWSNIAADARCAARNADPPHFCHSNLGFRVALVPEPK